MAGFVTQGLDSLMLDLQTVASMPEEVQDEILNAEADVVVAAQKRKVREMGIYDGESTVHVVNAIKKSKPTTKKGQRVIYVTPKGSRKRGNTTTRNAEILFVNEFGKRGQEARPAVATANAESAEDTTAAGMRVWSEFLEKNHL